MFNIDQSQNPYDLSNQIGNFYKGYQMAFIPQQMKDQQQLNAMKSQQMQQELQYNPQIYQAKIAALYKDANPQNDMNLTGDVANAVNVENMARIYGENDPRVIAARSTLKNQQNYNNAL